MQLFHECSNSKKDNQEKDYQDFSLPINSSDNETTNTIQDNNTINLSKTSTLAKLPLSSPVIISIILVLSILSAVTIFLFKSKKQDWFQHKLVAQVCWITEPRNEFQEFQVIEPKTVIKFKVYQVRQVGELDEFLPTSSK